MLTVIIPTLNAEAHLAKALAALVAPAIDGFVRQVIVVDGGSRDRTIEIADECGAEILRCAPGRGNQLALGAARARHPWLLFLHGDTVLDPSWADDAARLISDIETGRRAPAAGAFRFALDDSGLIPRVLEFLVNLRCGLFRLPYGDQGLLIEKRHYSEVGGYRDMAIMEDLDLIRRIGRRRITMLRTSAVTSADRYRRDGYIKRVARNQICLALFLLRAPIDRIARLYSSDRAVHRGSALTSPPPAE